MSTGIWSAAHAASSSAKPSSAQPPLGHEPVVAAAGRALVEQQLARAAGAQHRARLEVDQVAVLGRDRLAAELAALGLLGGLGRARCAAPRAICRSRDAVTRPPGAAPSTGSGTSIDLDPLDRRAPPRICSARSRVASSPPSTGRAAARRGAQVRDAVLDEQQLDAAVARGRDASRAPARPPARGGGRAAAAGATTSSSAATPRSPRRRPPSCAPGPPRTSRRAP